MIELKKGSLSYSSPTTQINFLGKFFSSSITPQIREQREIRLGIHSERKFDAKIRGKSCGVVSLNNWDPMMVKIAQFIYSFL